MKAVILYQILILKTLGCVEADICCQAALMSAQNHDGYPGKIVFYALVCIGNCSGAPKFNDAFEIRVFIQSVRTDDS